LKSATVAWDDDDLATGIESIGSLVQRMLSDDVQPTAWEAISGLLGMAALGYLCFF